MEVESKILNFWGADWFIRGKKFYIIMKLYPDKYSRLEGYYNTYSIRDPTIHHYTHQC